MPVLRRIPWNSTLVSTAGLFLLQISRSCLYRELPPRERMPVERKSACVRAEARLDCTASNAGGQRRSKIPTLLRLSESGTATHKAVEQSCATPASPRDTRTSAASEALHSMCRRLPTRTDASRTVPHRPHPIRPMFSLTRIHAPITANRKLPEGMGLRFFVVR